MPAGHERRAARCALRLDVVIGQQQTFAGEPIDIRCLRANGLGAAITAEVTDTDVVDVKEQDVGHIRSLRRHFSYPGSRSNCRDVDSTGRAPAQS